MMKNAILKHEQSPKAMSNQEKKSKGIFDYSILEHRERLAKATPMNQAADVSFIDSLIQLKKKNIKIPVRTYIPPHHQNSKQRIPTLFYIPGTAFVAGEIEFTRVVCSHLCKLTGCQVIVINHRLAPENQFPEGVQDVYEVIQFFLKEAPGGYIDPKRIAIAGYSSGGNIAALVSTTAGRNALYFNRQVLISPIVDLSRSLSDFQDFENKDLDISNDFVNWFLELYVPEGLNRKDPTISPFWQKKEDTKKQPPTSIIWGEFDRFRSDAEGYFKKLQKAGVDVKKTVFMA
jgi:acetyl esterase